MSSRESILFVNDQLILNPLEVLGGRHNGRRGSCSGSSTRRGGSGADGCSGRSMVFTALRRARASLTGRSTGGDTRVADLRVPAAPLPARSSTSSSRTCSRRAGSTAGCSCSSMVAVSIQSIFSLVYYRGLPDVERERTLESLDRALGDDPHERPVRLRARGVAAASARAWLRWSLVAARRPGRVGVRAVAAAGGDDRAVRRRRRPAGRRSSTAAGGRSGSSPRLRSSSASGSSSATWNATGAIGLPAQAVKTVLFPEPARRGRPQLRPVPADRGVRPLVHDPRRARSPGSASARSSYTPCRCPTSASSSSGSTSRTTRCCGSGSRSGSSASSPMLFMFARASSSAPGPRSRCARDEQVAVVVTGAVVRRHVHRLRLRRHRVGRAQHGLPRRRRSRSAATTSRRPTTTDDRRRGRAHVASWSRSTMSARLVRRGRRRCRWSSVACSSGGRRRDRVRLARGDEHRRDGIDRRHCAATGDIAAVPSSPTSVDADVDGHRRRRRARAARSAR